MCLCMYKRQQYMYMHMYITTGMCTWAKQCESNRLNAMNYAHADLFATFYVIIFPLVGSTDKEQLHLTVLVPVQSAHFQISVTALAWCSLKLLIGLWRKRVRALCVFFCDNTYCFHYVKLTLLDLYPRKKSRSIHPWVDYFSTQTPDLVNIIYLTFVLLLHWNRWNTRDVITFSVYHVLNTGFMNINLHRPLLIC